MIEKKRKKHNLSKKGEEDIANKEENFEDEDTELDEKDVLPKWYEQFKDDKPTDEKLPQDELLSLKIEAQHILDEETKAFNFKQSQVKKGYNTAWIKTVLKKGTAKDKVAANIVIIQNSPVHSLPNLTSLINSVNPAKKKECTIVMETLADLFIEDLLRPQRKLRSFDRQPSAILNEISGGCNKSRRLRLISWIYEDKLKELYTEFINAVNKVAKDTIAVYRIKAVSVMYRLLSSHPEQEQLLLSTLVNKMGDTEQKVVSKVIYCMTQLLRIHPNMKMVIMNEIEKLLFRPNINSRTQYYCICFLSQFIFQSKDKEIARNMITIYFSFFKALIKKGEIDSRLMGALLMGVRRAYPFANLDSNSIQQHVDTLYKLVHLTPFNIALHALALLQEISDDTNDRFYSALYKKLLDPKLNLSCHHAMFINLMFKALSKDSNTARVKAFIKRLLQVCLYSSVPLVCSLLYMISHVISRRKFSLFAGNIEPQNDAFAAYSLKENEDDYEENYIDADKEENKNEEDKVEEQEEKKPLRGWLHCEMNRRTSSAWSSLYNPMARNPAYSGADKTAYIELLYLSKHFHPTVALFSNKIIKQELITYTGDPLVDFTLSKFLERFVFKNPKVKSNEDKGPDPQLAQRKYYQPSGLRAIQVTSSRYLSTDAKDIPVDEMFLFNFLKEKFKGRRVVDNEKEDDNDSVTSEEFVELLDKMYGNKKSKNIDFMDEIEYSLKNKPNKKGNRNKHENENGETEDEDEDADEEEEEDFADFDKDVGDDNEVIDFGDDVEDFDDELDFEEAINNKSNKSRNKKQLIGKSQRKTKKKDDLENLFAPAEEFAEILEEAGSSKHKPGMAASLATNDNAAARQLDWETRRDRWVRDANINKRKWKGKSQKHLKKRRT